MYHNPEAFINLKTNILKQINTNITVFYFIFYNLCITPFCMCNVYYIKLLNNILVLVGNPLKNLELSTKNILLKLKFYPFSC